MLIRSFLETATNPNFLHSLFHNSLFRYHVLQHRDLPDPGPTPYYSNGFFETIREVHENSPLNVSTMSSREWYLLLVEDKVTMELQPNTDRQQPIKCKAEVANPNNDWDRTWRFARLKGLESEIITFLWRLLHKLLPTQDRIQRIVKKKPPHCQLCQDDLTEDLEHAFFHCRFNENTGQDLQRCLSGVIPGVSITQILNLDLQMNPSDEFSLIWIAGHFLFCIWSCRVAKKRIRLISIRSELEARANLLRETRFQDEATKILNLISVL